MSVDINDDSIKEEEENEISKNEAKRLSLKFVSSILTESLQSGQKKDPLNSSSKEIYLNRHNKVNEEQIQTPVKKNASQERPKNKTLSTEQKTKTNSKNTNKNTIPSNLSSAKKINYENRYKQKKANNNGTIKKNVKEHEKKDRNLMKPNITHNQFEMSYSAMNEKYKAKKESDKEKKLYQEKVRIMEKRINTLKNQEDEMQRRIHRDEIRQTYLNQKKKEKDDMKQALLSHDIDRRNELDLKRKTTKEQKNNLDKNLKQSMEKSKLSKMKDYENMQKEKIKALSIIYENNHKLEKYIKNNVNKVKKVRENIKKNEIEKHRNYEKLADSFYLETLEDNKIETNKLKNKLRQLEELETKYINKLNKTRQGMQRNNSEEVYFYKKDNRPIKKIDLDKQLDYRPFAKHSNKKNNNKKTGSVDNLDDYFKYNKTKDMK